MYLHQSMVSRIALVCIVVFSTSFSYARGLGLTENLPSQPGQYPPGSTGQPPGNIYPPSPQNVRQASQTSCLGWAVTSVGGRLMCEADENGNRLPEPIPLED